MASSSLRRIGLVRWVKVLTIRAPEDWEKALQYTNSVREIHCLDGAISAPYRSALSYFPRLLVACIDTHSDVHYDKPNRLAYRDVFTSLPSSLRRLQVANSHGPDIKIIGLVKRDCPLLEELRLGRCTLFNRHPACSFWRDFPFDHDSYMSIEGVEEYTHSLASELSPLQSLKDIQLGIYLIPSIIVVVHRLYHTRDQAAPVPFGWDQGLNALRAFYDEHDDLPDPLTRLVSILHRPAEQWFDKDTCYRCRELYFQASLDTEQKANSILWKRVPSLERIAWMNWFTTNHLGVSCQERD